MNFEFLLLVGIGVFIVIFIRGIVNKKKSYQLEVRGILALKQEIRSVFREKSTKFFTVEFGDYYIQFSKFPDTSDVYCNAVSNEYLDEKVHLSDEQYLQMKANGFYAPGEKDEEGNSSQNFFKFYLIEKDVEVDELLEELEKIMVDVYGYQTNHIIRLKVNPQ